MKRILVSIKGPFHSHIFLKPPKQSQRMVRFGCFFCIFKFVIVTTIFILFMFFFKYPVNFPDSKLPLTFAMTLPASPHNKRQTGPTWSVIPNWGLTVSSSFYEFDSEGALLVTIIGLSHRTAQSRGSFCRFGGLIIGASEHTIQFMAQKLDTTIFTCKMTNANALLDYFEVVHLEFGIKNVSVLLFPQPVLKQLLPKYELSMCLMKSLSVGDDWLRFTYFLEHHILQGVSHFVIYKRHWGPNFEKMIQIYAKAGIVSIIDWPGESKPLRFSSQGHTFGFEQPDLFNYYGGQWVIMHDCLLRLSSLTNFLAFLDIDELIVPVRTSNQTLLDHLKSIDEPNVGSFQFRHSFFVLSGGENYRNKEMGVVLRNVSRFLDLGRDVAVDSAIWPSGMRSKYIVKPKAVETLGIHTVTQFKSSLNVSEISIQSSKFLLINERASLKKVMADKADFGLPHEFHYAVNPMQSLCDQQDQAEMSIRRRLNILTK